MVAEINTCEVVILGAGIAGLSAAWDLRELDFVVLEAEDRTGGRIKSEPRGEYWLNFGAHVFAGPGSTTDRLLLETGVAAVEVPGVLAALAMNGRVLTSGPVESYPFRLPLHWRDRLALIRAGIRLRFAVAEYGRMSRVRPGESAAERRARILAFRGDTTFAQFLGPVPPDVDAIFRPTITRSSGEPEEVTAGYGIGYFQLVWDRESGLSRNILGGASQLPNAIARTLGDRVWTRSVVKEAWTEGGKVRVRYERDGVGHELVADYAVAAMPAYATRRAVRGLPEETYRALEAISYGPYVVGSFLTKESSPMPWDNLYAVGTAKKSFNMIFNFANILRATNRERKPGGSLMVYAGANLARRVAEFDDDRIAEIFTNDLISIYPEARGIIEEIVIQRWENGLPHPRPGRHLVQPALERPLGRIFLAGDYLGTSYTETAMETGTAAAAAIRESLAGCPGGG
jgi:oxygen-dependent protoporphyrinogen oxidase